MASYVDKIMRKGNVKGDRDALEELVDHLATLFSFLEDKDLFLMVYRQQLARRLLQEAYEDFEMEKNLITRLKVTCGMQQMNQMQGMLQDYQAVKEEAKEFDAFVESSPNTELGHANFDFSIQCLKTANWPMYLDIKLQMPPQINDKFEQFNRFYTNKHKRRKISIQFSLGESIVAMYVPQKPKPHELKLSTLGMFILLLFNESEAQQNGLTV